MTFLINIPGCGFPRLPAGALAHPIAMAAAGAPFDAAAEEATVVSQNLPSQGSVSIPSQERMDAAATMLERAMDGDNASIDPAAEHFARLLSQHPTDPLVMVYAGASTALRADGTWLPWRKLRYAADGLAQIDKAITLLTPAHDEPRADGTPVALETRFVAASTYLSLPGILDRRSRGQRMFDDVLSSPQLPGAPLWLRGAVWLRAGLEAIEGKRTADARQWLQQVVDGDAPQAATARAKLKELGS